MSNGFYSGIMGMIQNGIERAAGDCECTKCF